MKSIYKHPYFIGISSLIIFTFTMYLLTFPAVPQWYCDNLEIRINSEYEDNKDISVKLAIYKVRNWTDDYRASIWIRGEKGFYHEHRRYNSLYEMKKDIDLQINDYRYNDVVTTTLVEN